jgi:hypothetical protein
MDLEWSVRIDLECSRGQVILGLERTGWNENEKDLEGSESMDQEWSGRMGVDCSGWKDLELPTYFLPEHCGSILSFLSVQYRLIMPLLPSRTF